MAERMTLKMGRRKRRISWRESRWFYTLSSSGVLGQGCSVAFVWQALMFRRGPTSSQSGFRLHKSENRASSWRWSTPDGWIIPLRRSLRDDHITSMVCPSSVQPSGVLTNIVIKRITHHKLIRINYYVTKSNLLPKPPSNWRFDGN